jgi:hypothetical protein
VAEVQLLEEAQHVFVGLVHGAESPGSSLLLAPMKRSSTRF